MFVELYWNDLTITNVRGEGVCVGMGLTHYNTTRTRGGKKRYIYLESFVHIFVFVSVLSGFQLLWLIANPKIGRFFCIHYTAWMHRMLLRLTLWRHSDFMRTTRQTPVMWIQARHMTSAVAAWSRTLYILFICAWRICTTNKYDSIQYNVLLPKHTKSPS